MFGNIGGKIKKLATVITVIGIILSIIFGIMLSGEYGWAGLLVFIGGSLLSWISSFLLYGFGEIIDLLKNISGETADEDDDSYEVNNVLSKETDYKSKNSENYSSEADDNDFWICPQCNQKNKYVNKGNPQCTKCGWHL